MWKRFAPFIRVALKYFLYTLKYYTQNEGEAEVHSAKPDFNHSSIQTPILIIRLSWILPQFSRPFVFHSYSVSHSKFELALFKSPTFRGEAQIERGNRDKRNCITLSRFRGTFRGTRVKLIYGHFYSAPQLSERPCLYCSLSNKRHL